MNLPNKLTLLRIILVPFFMFCASQYYSAGYMLAACLIFSAASFTDFLDGHIARKYNLVTNFGKFADPLADKLLTTVAFIYMMQMNACDPIVLVIIIAREFAVSGLRMVAASSKEKAVIAANIWGKVKTVSQMLTIILFYLWMAYDCFASTGQNSMYTSQLVGYILCWVVALITAISGVVYILDNKKFLKISE